jgi:phage-related protein
VKFLGFFTPALITFLTGVIDLANATMPFLHDLGRLLSGSLAMIGEDFSEIAKDPSFNDWLVDMKDTLTSVANLFFTVFKFLAVFMAQLNEAGGKKTIDEITKSLEMLIFVLSSPVGMAAMRGLVNFAVFSIQAFTGLVIVVIAVIAIFQSMFDAIELGVTWIWEHVLKPFFQGIADFFNWLLGKTEDFERGTKNAFGSIAGFAKSVSSKIVAAMNIYERLKTAGRNIIRGLIDGITSQLGALWNAMSKAMGVIGGFLPGSPAEQGPLSGKGFAELRGQRMMGDLMAGIKAELPALRSTSNEVANNIVFGPNSIKMEFHGTAPSQSQARGIGTAVGQSAAGILANRNTRLAVRAL